MQIEPSPRFLYHISIYCWQLSPHTRLHSLLYDWCMSLLLETLVVWLFGAISLSVPIAVLILAIVAFVRSQRIPDLEKRIHQLESRLAQKEPAPATVAQRPSASPVVTARVIDAAAPPLAPQPSFQWEQFIGQKAFGWVAVVLSIFSAAFFLRYSYDNNWIGPVGRVGIGVLAGCGLMIAGHRYHRRGARIFSQMLSACGVVVLFLSSYTAFGFYSLLPAGQAGVFLAVIVVLSMVCAVLYDSAVVALMAVLGGLATPLLLPSEHDRYMALFAYLAGLNLGVLVVAMSRSWRGIASVALLGTQTLFWTWYGLNFHPEKRGWAIAFQALIYAMFLLQDIASHFTRQVASRWDNTSRTLLNAAFWFAAFYVLMKDDYRVWMGVAAVIMAGVYTAEARLLLAFRPKATANVLTAIAVSLGLIVVAIPLQADTRWIALGWAATAATLWWFGLRIESPVLGTLASTTGFLSVTRVIFIDLQAYPLEALTKDA